jgi:CubicO group peptidase (beta-lactamase class C family)
MNLKSWLIALAVLGGCATNPTTTSSPGGFSSERLRHFDAAVRAEVDAGRIPGFVMIVARDGQVVLSDAYGKQDPNSGTPMTHDSIFRIYSMTKPIVSVAAMILVEEGRMQLADPVTKYIPELKDLKVGVEKGGTLELVAARRPITIQDLMRHTSGFTLWRVRQVAREGPVHEERRRQRRSHQHRVREEARDRAACLPAGQHVGLQPLDRRAWARSRARERPAPRPVPR